MKTETHTCECGEHAWFAITKGYVTFVDAALAPAFSCWRWHALLDNGNVYAARTQSSNSDGRKIDHKLYAHQLVLPMPSGLVVDHRDGCGLNNRRKNLRPLTSQANAHHQKKKAGKSSEFKGVSYRNGSWYACIQIGGKQIGLGLHKTEISAAEAYNAAAALHYGALASLNNVSQSARAA